MHALALMVALLGDGGNHERYQLQDLYCYNEHSQIEVLKVSPKLFFIKNDDVISQFSEEEFTSFLSWISFSGRLAKISEVMPGIWLVEYNKNSVSPELMFDFISKFPDYQVALLKKPVGVMRLIFVWRGQEVVVGDHIISEVRPSVADKERLREIIHNLTQLAIVDIQEIEGKPNRYKIQFDLKDLKFPANIFVLANLLSENNAYFKWARPDFIQVRPSIGARMFVTDNGMDSLGDKKFLHLEISILNPRISFRKDLVPQLGRGEFILTADFEDILFWADQPTITEEQNDQEKIINFVWPFVYLNTGNFTFKDIVIAYNEEIDGSNVERVGTVKGPSFQVGSVLAGVQPPITDIQPMRYYRSSFSKKDLTETPDRNDWRYYLNLSVAALSFAGGLSLLGAVMAACLLPKIREYRNQRNIRLSDKECWDKLLRLAANISIENWRESYRLIEAQLKLLLVKFLRYPPDISSEKLVNSKDIYLYSAFVELERAYSGDENITYQDVLKLNHNLKTFAGNYRGGRIHA